MPQLSPDQKRALMSAIENGDELDPSLQDVLFPAAKREYELKYADKMRREDVVSQTLGVPLQAVRFFGAPDHAFEGDEWHNRLIWGDNLQSMKSLLDMKKAGRLKNQDGTDGVRLIYIDPPFATKQEFQGGQGQRAYSDKIAGARFIEAMRRRLILMHELLSDDGSLYLHLDTKKVHYLKIVLDEVFGEAGFRNEIIWRRQSAHSDSKQCGAIHEDVLFYSKSEKYVWNEILTQPSPDYLEQFFDCVEEGTGRRYARGDLSAGGLSGGGYEYEFMGVHYIWRCPKSTLERLEKEKRLHWPQKGVPRLKRYLDEFEGVPLQDIWNDIRVIHNRSPERIGYPTQKPEALLERIIRASSNEGDIVLDAFVGSGTTCAVAEKLGRRWIGIDAGKLAIYTTQKRLLS